MAVDLWSNLAAVIALAGLIAYTLLGGADFGGGVLDLLARGPRKQEQRKIIAAAMGPVWEANHVWLIFLLVVLFTCFPHGYSALATALFIPMHLALAGIMMRGASFVFRGFTVEPSGRHAMAPQEAPSAKSFGGTMPRPPRSVQGKSGPTGRPARWGVAFGVASVISPFMLGTAFGALTAGDVRMIAFGRGDLQNPIAWLYPYPLACGLLALSACTYLAAVYLMNESYGQVREDFRRRAVVAGTATAALALIVLVLAARTAEWFFHQLLSPRSWPVLAAGVTMFALSAWAVFTRRHRAARVFAAGEILLLLVGWGLAHYPYLAYPDITFANSAAPRDTVRFLVLAVPVGLLILVPSLWMLFAVFKRSSRVGG